MGKEKEKGILKSQTHVEHRLRWGLGPDVDAGGGGGLKNIKEFRNHRHVLNADSDGGGDQMQKGVGGGV